jgi:hypothetical protein
MYPNTPTLYTLVLQWNESQLLNTDRVPSQPCAPIPTSHSSHHLKIKYAQYAPERVLHHSAQAQIPQNPWILIMCF